MKKELRKSESFFETLEENPKELIEWAESEIREYKNLIKLIKCSLKKKKS